MNIEDRISHLVNITFLLDHFEKAGAPKNKWMVKEFETQNNGLIEALKEKHDETRTSDKQRNGVDEDRTDLKSSERRGSSPDGRTRRDADGG